MKMGHYICDKGCPKVEQHQAPSMNFGSILSAVNNSSNTTPSWYKSQTSVVCLTQICYCRCCLPIHERLQPGPVYPYHWGEWCGQNRHVILNVLNTSEKCLAGHFSEILSKENLKLRHCHIDYMQVNSEVNMAGLRFKIFLLILNV